MFPESRFNSAKRRTPRIFPLPCSIREFSRCIIFSARSAVVSCRLKQIFAEETDDAEDCGDNRREIARQRRSDSHPRLFHFRTAGARRNSWRRQFRLDRSPAAITGRAGRKLIRDQVLRAPSPPGSRNLRALLPRWETRTRKRQ